MTKHPQLPRGTKRAIKLALELAIRVLEGDKPIQIPQVHPRMARQLRRAQTALLREKWIWP